MPYELYIGHISDDTITFNDLKDVIGVTHAGRVSLIGGQAEIREMIDPSKYSGKKRQLLDQFTANAVRYFMLKLESEIQLEAARQKLEESDLPLIFFGTHGAGDIP
ncbi:MAG TPA: hypothetical protein VIF64_07300 [Pyrinomonadaceae bacterium]